MGCYQDFGLTDEQAWGGTPDDYDDLDDDPCPLCSGCGCRDCECDTDPDEDAGWCDVCQSWHDDPCTGPPS